MKGFSWIPLAHSQPDSGLRVSEASAHNQPDLALGLRRDRAEDGKAELCLSMAARKHKTRQKRARARGPAKVPPLAAPNPRQRLSLFGSVSQIFNTRAFRDLPIRTLQRLLSGSRVGILSPFSPPCAYCVPCPHSVHVRMLSVSLCVRRSHETALSDYLRYHQAELLQRACPVKSFQRGLMYPEAFFPTMGVVTRAVCLAVVVPFFVLDLSQFPN